MSCRSLPLSAGLAGGREQGCSRSRPMVRGFSLVELMIAIMILGLGLVMAATVFPVSLDVTKGTLQLNISQAAADAAAATLAIRLPNMTKLDGTPPPPHLLRLRFPYVWAIEDDAKIETHEQQYLELAEVSDFLSEPPNPPLTLPIFLANTRVYTEWSFWNAERFSLLPGVLSSPVFPVDAQNLAPGLIPVLESLPMPVPGFTPSPARISIADRVYPPVDLCEKDGVTFRPLESLDPKDLGILNEIASRRYCWAALHYRDLTDDQKQNNYFCQIVLLYRGKLESRYIRQATYPYNPYDPNTSGLPVFDPPVGSPIPSVTPEVNGTNDTLFPQAWMAAVNVNKDTGIIECDGSVAKLLPAGSYIIDVWDRQTPGAFAKIVKNNWDGINLVDPTTLQIAPGSFSNGPRQIWFFPPAVEFAPDAGRTMDRVRFERTSPVVDVIPKRIYTQ